MEKIYNINKKKKSVLGMIIMLIVFSFPVTTMAAPSEDTIRSVFSNFPELFVNNSMFLDACRTIGWGCVKGLHWLADNSCELYRNTLGIVDFTNNAEIKTQIFEKLQIIFPAIMAVSIMALGITLIINHEKKPKILMSLFLIVLSVGAGNFLLVNLNHVSDAASEIAGDTVVDDIISENIYDLVYMSNHNNNGLSTLANGAYANDSEKADFLSTQHYSNGTLNVDRIDITEVINYNSSLINNADDKGKSGILGQRIVAGYTADGEYIPVLKEVDNGFGWNSDEDTDFFNEFYYRYKADYFSICLQYIAICIIYICMAYKVIRLIIEIITGHIMAYLYSADLNGQQKTIKCLMSVLNGYNVLLLSAVCLRIYTIAQAYLHDKFYTNHKFTYIILLLFLAFSIIDAPNVIQQVTGIDAGLQPGAAKLLAMGQAMRTAGHVATAPLSMFQQIQSGKYYTSANNANKASNNTVNSETNQNQGNVPPSSSSENTNQNSTDQNANNDNTDNQNNNVNNQDINNNSNDSLERDGLDGEANTNTPDVSGTINTDAADMVNLDSDSQVGQMQNDTMSQMDNDWNNMQNSMEDMTGKSGLGNQMPTGPAEDTWKQYGSGAEYFHDSVNKTPESHLGSSQTSINRGHTTSGSMQGTKLQNKPSTRHNVDDDQEV